MSAGILDGFQTIIPTAAAVLSEKRQILRLTQQEVADRAKITLRQYQRLESGERNILTSSFGLACRVIEALDMDVSKFYHGDYYLGSSVLTHKKEQQIKIEGEFKPTVDCLCATHCRFVFIHKGIDAILAIKM